MKDTKQLSEALGNMQSRVIGLFRPRFYPLDRYIPVISNDNGVLVCVEVGTLLGLQTLTIGITEGRYVQFPETNPAYHRTQKKNQTLSDMMNDPIRFDQWYKENITK